MSKLREEIIKRFRDPKYGYKGKYIFYKELKNEFPNITFNRVKEILDSNKDYSIYKPIPKKYLFPIYSRFHGTYQADLADMPVDDVTDHRYILCVINVNTCYAFCFSSKTKSIKDILPKIEKIILKLASEYNWMQKIYFDKGKNLKILIHKIY